MASKEFGKLVITTEIQEELDQPASPTTRYLNSSVLSLAILAVFESEIPVDNSNAVTLLRDRFLPMNHRFSSILITDKKGVQRWKKVDVVLEDHVKVPIFPTDLSIEFYDECFQEYISMISMEKLCESRPLWELHIFKYPTSGALGTIVMKLHHALGDGFSLMGALFSCLKRADDSSLPLTFPSSISSSRREEIVRPGAGSGSKSRLKKMAKNMVGFWNTVSDTAWSLMKSTVMEDDLSSIRSKNSRSVPKPISISTVTFPLDHLLQIKLKVAGVCTPSYPILISHQYLSLLAVDSSLVISLAS